MAKFSDVSMLENLQNDSMISFDLRDPDESLM